MGFWTIIFGVYGGGEASESITITSGLAFRESSQQARFVEAEHLGRFAEEETGE